MQTAPKSIYDAIPIPEETGSSTEIAQKYGPRFCFGEFFCRKNIHSGLLSGIQAIGIGDGPARKWKWIKRTNVDEDDIGWGRYRSINPFFTQQIQNLPLKLGENPLDPADYGISSETIPKSEGSHKSLLSPPDDSSVSIIRINEDRSNPEQLANFLREIHLMNKLEKCKRTASCRLYGFYKRENEPLRAWYRPSVTFPSSLAKLDYIILSSEEKAKLILQSAKALRNLHQMGYVHGNIQAQHFLYGFYDDSKKVAVRICDFSTCVKKTKLQQVAENHVERGRKWGTPFYRSPEFHEYFLNPDQRPIFNEKIDVWAFGMLLWKIALFGNGKGLYPSWLKESQVDFNGLTQDDINKNFSPELVSNWKEITLPPTEFKYRFAKLVSVHSNSVIETLCYACTQLNPDDRPNMEQVCEALECIGKIKLDLTQWNWPITNHLPESAFRNEI